MLGGAFGPRELSPERSGELQGIENLAWTPSGECSGPAERGTEHSGERSWPAEGGGGTLGGAFGPRELSPERSGEPPGFEGWPRNDQRSKDGTAVDQRALLVGPHGTCSTTCLGLHGGHRAESSVRRTPP